MTMHSRKWVFDVLINSPELTAIVGNRIFSASSLGIDPNVSAPQRPFLVYRAETSNRSMVNGMEVQPYSFYVHDDQGPYVQNIEPALEAVKNAFQKRAPEFWDGKQIFSAKWQSVSGDLYDDAFRTATRYAYVEVETKS